MRERDVRAPLTNKAGRYRETGEFMGMIRRGIRALTRRVGDGGDIEQLPAMLQLQRDLDEAISTAVAGLRRDGYSWAEIADRVGITRQSAHERWNRKVQQVELARVAAQQREAESCESAI
jgi:DNA invertase Pin-like site-specific DNA recombinase